MKKVLFATTALIATASVAAADVRLSGYGRFGLDYNEANKNVVGRSETNITSRLRLQFDMSAETDGGVGFNARYRAQAESRDGVAGGAVFNGARFGVTYGGLLVNVGNILGAIDNAPGLYATGTRSAGTGIDGQGFQSLAIKSLTVNAGGTWTGGTRFNFDNYDSTGAGSNGVEALYTVGGFTGHISYSQRNGGTVAGSAGGEERTAIMLTYSFGDYYVTGAYQGADNTATVTAANGTVFDPNDGLYFLAAGADWGQFGAKVAYGSTDVADSVTVEGNFDLGAASNILVWVNSTDVDSALTAAANGTAAGTLGAAANGMDGTSFGINYQYDLGGGATFVAGATESAADNTEVQAGVYFSF
ncbi:porin [Sedimentitalea sp. HM32M-2]|uniref:porin n=1 Tax=Sedimentitalea sp. HM32M-2 TaxID=3351566 RepID=UPI0036D32882